jgi:hypothetical protein
MPDKKIIPKQGCNEKDGGGSGGSIFIKAASV